MKHILMAAVVFGVTAASTWAHTLENEFLRLEVGDDGKVTIHDKRIGVTWLQAIPDSKGPSDPENTPVVTSVEPSPSEITVHLKWQIPLLCRWSLSGPDNVCASLESRDEDATVPGDRWKAAYPPPFYASGAADFAVVCEDEGALYSTAETDRKLDRFRYGSGPMGRARSMPWAGVTDGKFSTGMMMLVDTPFYAVQEMVVCDTPDGRRALPGIQWHKDRHKTFTPRSLRFHLFPEGGYVAMAKRFRSELIADGKFRTLAEKAREVPRVEKLKSAMDMWIFPPGEEAAHRGRRGTDSRTGLREAPATGDRWRRLHSGWSQESPRIRLLDRQVPQLQLGVRKTVGAGS